MTASSSQLIAARIGNLLELAHHVVGKISDGAADQRRQSRHAHRLIARDKLAQKFHGLPVFQLHAAIGFQHARAMAAAENLRGICPDECVARDFFAAFHAFEKTGVVSVARKPQIGGDRSEQIGADGFVHGNEIPLPRHFAKCFEIGLNHSSFENTSTLNVVPIF